MGHDPESHSLVMYPTTEKQLAAEDGGTARWETSGIKAKSHTCHRIPATQMTKMALLLLCPGKEAPLPPNNKAWKHFPPTPIRTKTSGRSEVLVLLGTAVPGDSSSHTPGVGLSTRTPHAYAPTGWKTATKNTDQMMWSSKVERTWTR